jgi:hypothetical protein
MSSSARGATARDAGGRFAKAGAAPVPRGRVPVDVQKEHAHRAKHGWNVIKVEEPELARAVNRRVREIVGEIDSGHRLYSELVSEARAFVRGEMQFEAIDAFILGLGERAIDKKRRRVHQIMRDRRELAAELGAARERIARLKSAVDLEARISALEARKDV